MRRGVLQDVGTPTQVYGRPATLYVAAFLGAPRMNLLEAQVYVHLDRHIALHMGDQTLYLPWNDIRARAVAQQGPAALHVADDHADPAGGQLDHVVQVAAHLRVRAGRVAHADGDTVRQGKVRGQK